MITHKHSREQKKTRETKKKAYARSLTPFCTYLRRVDGAAYTVLHLPIREQADSRDLNDLNIYTGVSRFGVSRASPCGTPLQRRSVSLSRPAHVLSTSFIVWASPQQESTADGPAARLFGVFNWVLFISGNCACSGLFFVVSGELFQSILKTRRSSGTFRVLANGIFPACPYPSTTYPGRL